MDLVLTVRKLVSRVAIIFNRLQDLEKSTKNVAFGSDGKVTTDSKVYHLTENVDPDNDGVVTVDITGLGLTSVLALSVTPISAQPPTADAIEHPIAVVTSYDNTTITFIVVKGTAVPGLGGNSMEKEVDPLNVNLIIIGK